MALKDGRGTVNGYKIGPNENLWNAKLEGADLAGANLHGANLHGADLRGADLQHADLSDTNFWRADLRGAMLWNSNLHHAYLAEANLSGAGLSGAYLVGADFTGATVDPHHVVEMRRAFTKMCDSLNVNGGRAPNPRYSPLPPKQYLTYGDLVDEERAKAEYFEAIQSGRYPHPHDTLRSPVRSPARKRRGR